MEKELEKEQSEDTQVSRESWEPEECFTYPRRGCPVQCCESKALGGLGREGTAGEQGLVETGARFQGVKECVGGKEMESADGGQEEKTKRWANGRGQEVVSFKHESLV